MINRRKQKKKMYKVTSVVVSLRMGRRHIGCHGLVTITSLWSGKFSNMADVIRPIPKEKSLALTWS